MAVIGHKNYVQMKPGLLCKRKPRKKNRGVNFHDPVPGRVLINVIKSMIHDQQKSINDPVEIKTFSADK